MKHATLALALLLSGCATTSWPALVHCLPGPADLIEVIGRILLGDVATAQDEDPGEGRHNATIGERAAEQLEELGRQRGPGVVACVMDELARGWLTTPRTVVAGTPPWSARYAAAERARDFLARRGTRTERAEP
jgi:hypothetical protein